MLPTSGDQGGRCCWEAGRVPSWEEGCRGGDPAATHLDGATLPQRRPLGPPAPRLQMLRGEAGRVLPARRGLQRLPNPW